MNLVSLDLNLMIIALISAVACVLILGLLLHSGLAWKLALDQPNARSLHVVPTPRCGGWGIVPVILATTLLTTRSLWPLMLGMLVLAFISYLDDRSGLSARVRFVAHAVTVLFVLIGTGRDLPAWGLIVLALIWIWAINLYNFMDGADGLAGCMTLSGFATYAVAGSIHPPLSDEAGLHSSLVITASATAGAALGFLFFNRPPARIFLGDVGSVPLGFLAAGLGYTGWHDGLWPLWFPFLVFAPFVLDATITLLKRLLRGERVWEAHCEHYYQRMIRSGISHGRTAVIWFGLMLVSGTLALLLLEQNKPIQWVGVAGWSAILIGAGIMLDQRWARFEKAPS